MEKKLQVFVSSTYQDLREERQRAVQEILNSRHIPAGMELFTAGDESQLQTIYRWIDESDVFMLILGGRYGSIEPNSKKSYIQLEYEYALENAIPIFAVVLSSSYLENKISKEGLNNVMEQTHLADYQSFKDLVLKKIVKMVNELGDIGTAVFSSLQEFSKMDNLVGWVRSDTSNALSLLTKNLELEKEITQLNRKNTELTNTIRMNKANQMGKYSYENLYNLLIQKKFVIPPNILDNENYAYYDALNIFYQMAPKLCNGIICDCNSIKNLDYLESYFFFFNLAPFYLTYNLIYQEDISGTTLLKYQISEIGLKFYKRLLDENNE